VPMAVGPIKTEQHSTRLVIYRNASAMRLDAPDRCPLAFYFLRVTTAAIAALQSSPKLVMASLMQATFWIRRRSVLHCFCTSARHVFPAAATSANLALHTSERSATCSLTQVAIRRFPGSMLAQTFLISAAQAPTSDCAIALDTRRNDKVAQIDKIFSI
jgi:hypothetical protein